MTNFNPDGSLRLPDQYEQKRIETNNKMKTKEFIKIERKVVSDRPPKQCSLHLTISDAFLTNFFVEKIYKEFLQSSQVPTKLKQITEKEFEITINTHFRRCSDCTNLIKRFRTFLDGNIIENKGSCTLKERDFTYEDYFE